MKNSTIFALTIGMIAGAVGVTLCKPAQNIVKKSTDFVKEEAQSLMSKNKKQQ